MLVSLTELREYRIKCTDGEIGRIKDLMFLQDEWIVRYIVADTEDMDTEPLLDVADIRRLDRGRHTLLVNLSRDDVANAPTADVEESSDEHDEEEAQELYGWPPDWMEEGREATAMGKEPDVVEPVKNPDAEESGGPELQRASDLPGLYSVEADGGETGTLSDFVIEDETWAIPYLVVGTALQAERRVLIATDYVQSIDWLGKSIHVSLTVDDISGSPAFTSEEPITPAFERSLREYYDRYSR